MSRSCCCLLALLLSSVSGCLSMPHPPLDEARTPIQRMRWATRDRLDAIAESDAVTCIVVPIGIVGNLVKGSWNSDWGNNSLDLMAR